MVVKVFLLMLLCHIIDDFCLQLSFLSNAKQKKFWEPYGEKYKNDWIPSIIIHGLEWSIMVHLPIMIMLPEVPGYCLFINILLQAACHSCIDHCKCNMLILNLAEDQILHLVQIILSVVLFFFL